MRWPRRWSVRRRTSRPSRGWSRRAILCSRESTRCTVSPRIGRIWRTRSGGSWSWSEGGWSYILIMRDSEFWRVVEEICVLLKLNQPSTHQVIEFYKKLAASETHSFRPEVRSRECRSSLRHASSSSRRSRRINTKYGIYSISAMLWRPCIRKPTRRREPRKFNISILCSSRRNWKIPRWSKRSFRASAWTEYSSNYLVQRVQKANSWSLAAPAASPKLRPG